VREPRDTFAGLGTGMEREYIRRKGAIKSIPIYFLRMTAPLLLAIDAGSPRVSVATGRGGEVLAERAVEIERSSGKLLGLIGEVLSEAGARPADLGGVVALRGPGSFTGLRVGLATALGLHQALGAPATALPTLLVLAAQAGGEGTVVAAVDALRGEWSAQAFDGRSVPRPLGDMELVPGSALPLLFGAERSGILTGFGVSRLAELADWPEEVQLVEAGPLAATAIRVAWAAPLPWDPSLLVHPLYSRPPAISLPKAPRHKIVT
jgi:tRNA threonylcarbamoyladenosine biosynthesis protein TsaB